MKVFIKFCLLLIVFAASLNIAPHSTYACSCAEPPPPKQALQEATAVFAGKVLEDEKTSTAKNFGQFKQVLEEKSGFIKAMWCGDRVCEDQIREETGATSRCIPFNQEKLCNHCVCCGEDASHMVYWARAY